MTVWIFPPVGTNYGRETVHLTLPAVPEFSSVIGTIDELYFQAALPIFHMHSISSIDVFEIFQRACENNLITIEWVPSSVTKDYCAHFLTLLKEVASTNSLEAWKKFAIWPWLILHSSGSASLPAKLVRSRLDLWAAGDFVSLIHALPSLPRSRASNTSAQEVARRHKRVERELQNGYFSKAFSTLTSTSPIAEPSPETLEALQELHPPAPVGGDFLLELPQDFPTILSSEVETALSKLPRGKSPGMTGMRFEFLKLAYSVSGDEFIQALTQMVNAFASARLPSAVPPLFASSRLIPLTKSGGGIRPIAMADSFRKLVAKIIATRLTNPFLTLLRPHQYRIALRGGLETLTTELSIDVDHTQADVVISLDAKNAFNTLSRTVIKQRIQEANLVEFIPYMHCMYGTPSRLFCKGTGRNPLFSSTGVQQG